MRIHNLIILDASGSMSYIYEQALSGVNETIQTIRHAQEQHPELRQYVTLASFANPDDLNRIYQAEPIEFVKNIHREDYPLRGCTALHDAIGTLVGETQKRIQHDDAVLVTIITDGYENASRHWSGSQIKSLVEELRQMGWTFTYIGANQDAHAEASKLGIRNHFEFRATADGTSKMFACESRSRKRYYEAIKECECAGSAPCAVDEFFEEMK